MVQFLSIIFFLFLQFLLGFSKVPDFLCHSVYTYIAAGFVRVPRYMTSRKYRGVLCRDQVILRASPSAEAHLF